MKTEVSISLLDMLMCLSNALDMVSVRIADHNKQVACLSLFIAEALDIPRDELIEVTLAGLLHDIGALSLKDKLNLLDYDIEDTHRHSELGYRFLRGFTPLSHLAPIIRHHHAKWKHGETASHDDAVSQASFIIHLADRIAILMHRDRPILSQMENIIETIRKGSGALFNPEHVEAFRSIADREFFWLASASCGTENFLTERLRDLAGELDFNSLTPMAELFGRVIDFRCSFTAIHSSRVSAVAEALGRYAGMSAESCHSLSVAGYLHDLGKLAVPAEILEKPAPLNEEEWCIMKSHSYHSWRLLRVIKGMDWITKCASSHHERIDGKGYPFRYSGNELGQGGELRPWPTSLPRSLRTALTARA